MEYYINMNNEKRGPYNTDELAARGLSAETLVMAENQQQWLPAWQVEELRPILARHTAPTTLQQTDSAQTREAKETPLNGLPLVEAVPVERSRTNSYGARTDDDDAHYNAYDANGGTNGAQTRHTGSGKQGKRHWGCLFTMLVVAILAATMVMTCPEENSHKDKIKTVTATALNHYAEEKLLSGDNLIMQGLREACAPLVEKAVDWVVDNHVSVDNYLVCSIGRMEYNNKERIVSVGVFNHVFTVDEEQVQEMAGEYFDNAFNKVKEVIRQQLKEHLMEPLNSVIDFISDLL